MTRLVGLFFALAMLLGCGGESVAVQRGAALQPPVACCVPQRLPESAWCSSSTVPGVNGWVVCSSSPFYTGSRCALLVRGNAPDLYGYGWTVNGWNVSLLRGDASVEFQWLGAAGYGYWWPDPPAPLEHAFSAADHITDVWSW